MYPRENLRRAMALYAVTDRAWLGERTLSACVEEALAGGATFVQLREKDAPQAEVVLRARALAPLCREAGVPFVVNDDVEAARIAGADGVHVGQDDAACVEAREKLGPDAIVGVSVQTVEQALVAQADGADYLGVGAVFGTPTKPDAADLSHLPRNHPSHHSRSEHPRGGHRRPERAYDPRARGDGSRRRGGGVGHLRG